ncbi:MAG: hypothetical protein K2N88_05600 [Muribaculaceae bacterium]|nr:hypothetical protein [Muribaculaceae bacterium]
MKTLFRKYAMVGIVALLSLIGLTNCTSSTVWWDDPGYGWSYRDPNLTGFWQLVEVNGYAVSNYNTNFLYFDGNGRGLYYYYDQGYRETEKLRYWAQEGYTSSNYQLNIQYQYSAPLTSVYWFSDRFNTLWLQWVSPNGGLDTYAYRRISYAPW